MNNTEMKMEEIKRKPYVAPTIEFDEYVVEMGYNHSQAWNQETVSLLTDNDGNVDDEGAGWFEGDGIIF